MVLENILFFSLFTYIYLFLIIRIFTNICVNLALSSSFKSKEYIHINENVTSRPCLLQTGEIQPNNYFWPKRQPFSSAKPSFFLGNVGDVNSAMRSARLFPAYGKTMQVKIKSIHENYE